MRKNMKGIISMLVTMVLVLAALPMTVAASDYETHWAKDSIDRLVQKGVITLEDGNARPGDNVTRCEVVAMIVDGLAIKAEGEASFSDIADDEFAAQILTAVNAGITNGYEDGTFRPKNAVTREEVATFFARAMKLADNAEAAAAFPDAAAISEWAKGAVGATVTAKLIGGYPDGTFGPKGNMTRAEAMKITDFALGGAPAEVVKGDSVTLAEGESYGEDGKITEVAYLVVDGPGVTVKNVVVNGDLTLTKNVGNGEVSLLGVDVKGKTLVLGGGPNSVVIGNTDLVESHHTELVVLVANVTIKLESGEIETISVEMQAKVTVGKDGVITALIVATNAPVTLSGEILGVSIQSAGANVTLTDGKISELTVTKDGVGAKIKTEKGAEIIKAIADAASIFFGQGAIGSLAANTTGVTSEQIPGESKGTHMVETFTNAENKDMINTSGTLNENPESTGGGSQTNPPGKSATISNATITGTVDAALAGTDVTITLTGTAADTFTATGTAQGNNVASWFNGLPANMTAVVKTAPSGGNDTIEITLGGTPKSHSTANIKVTIPKASLTGGATIYTATNASAKYAIAKAAVIKPTISNTSPRFGDAALSVSNAQPTITYSWKVDGVEKARTATYTVTAADIGKPITVTVTGTGSYDGTETSDATAAVGKMQVTLSSAVADSGNPTPSIKLTFDKAIADGTLDTANIKIETNTDGVADAGAVTKGTPNNGTVWNVAISNVTAGTVDVSIDGTFENYEFSGKPTASVVE